MRLHGFVTVVVCVAGAFLLAGCFGEKVDLPPVTAAFSVAQGVTFGPSSGLTPGKPLNGYTLVDGLTCNLPTEDEIKREIKRQVGNALGGLISLDKVELDRIILATSSGDMSSLTGLFLGFVTVGAGGVTPVPLGVASAPQGFGKSVTVTPLGDVDLLPILKQPKPTCGAAVVTTVGSAPEKDVTLDVSIQVTAHFQIGPF